MCFMLCQQDAVNRSTDSENVELGLPPDALTTLSLVLVGM